MRHRKTIDWGDGCEFYITLTLAEAQEIAGGVVSEDVRTFVARLLEGGSVVESTPAPDPQPGLALTLADDEAPATTTDDPKVGNV